MNFVPKLTRIIFVVKEWKYAVSYNFKHFASETFLAYLKKCSPRAYVVHAVPLALESLTSCHNSYFKRNLMALYGMV